MKKLIVCSIFILVLVYGGSAVLNGMKAQMDNRTTGVNELLDEAGEIE